MTLPTAARTLYGLIRQVRNWPLFLYDWALTGYAPSRRWMVYRFRDGTQLAVRPFTADKWVLTDIWLRDPYWHPAFQLSATPVFLDIGAHIGGWTVYMSRRWPSSRIIACEPVPETFALLQENIRRNQLTRVTALNVALAPRPGSLTLFFDREYSAYSATHPRRRHQKGTSLSVPARTLSQALARAGATHVDLLKCDIEGAEFSLLPSLSSDLLGRINNISLEYHLFSKDQHVETLLAFFDQHGFELLECTPTLTDSGYVKFRRRR